jgi:hypothetical protein
MCNSLNPYPHDSFDYFPQFSGEDHVTAESHTEAFENFIDQFEIVHEDVVIVCSHIPYLEMLLCGLDV